MSDNWNGRKVLVTGAGGFIGSHLTEALIELGAETTAMIRYSSRSDWGNLEFLPADKKATLHVVAGSVEDSQFVSREMRGKDVVFHLAALIGIPYSYIAPQSYVRTNVEGTTNILEAARIQAIGRVVLTSTSETYGSARYFPIDEGHPMQPQSPYSASKIAADMVAESFYRTFETPVSIVRPFNTFGPRQSARAIIPTIISQALSPASEVRLGALTPVRDFTFVHDIVRGFIAMAEYDDAVGQAVNFGSGRGITVGDLAARILKIAGVEKPIVQDEAQMRPAGSEVYELIADSSKAKALLGWQTKHDLSAGLAATVEFVRNHSHLFRPSRYTV